MTIPDRTDDTGAEGLRLRSAVRAVVVDPADRVLLVRFEFPERVVWATPGGGLEDGEDPDAALRRELREELGLDDPDIGPEVWRRTHVFPFLDGSADGQRERYFLVETEPFEPRPELGWEVLRQEHVTDARWWPLDELLDSAAHFAPRRLPTLVRRLLADGPPREPIDTGV